MKLGKSLRLVNAAALLLLVAAACAHGAIFTVTNVNDSGPGSLRQAILDSNATPPGPNVINFNIPGVAPFLIFPVSPLPPITVPVTIDGCSQPGTTQNTLANADNAVQTIVINGFFQAGGNGLTVNANGTVIRCLVINNFTASNLELNGNNNVVQGVFLGVDATGSIAGTGLGTNLLIQGSNNQIGGTTPAARNIISADFIGIYMFNPGATGNMIQGNFIGLAADGATALPNYEGIFIYNAPNNTVGGTVAGSGNVISGNSYANVYIYNTPASGNLIQGNLIGTNAAGTAAVAATTLGIMINIAPNNTVGGPSAAAGNVVSGNVYGMQIAGGATGNTVDFNKIGTDKTGTLPVPNALGIQINSLANDNTIGPNNIIAFNTGDGVQVDGAGTNHNTITQNSIFSNGTLGINLTNGGNDMLPAPVLTSASNNGGTTVMGTLTVPSQPNTQFRIEFFANDVCEAGGKTFIGFTNVMTNGAGFAAFSPVYPLVPPGSSITATATDPAGNTSEFSNCATIAGTPSLTVTKTPVTSTVQAGTNAIFLIHVTNNGTGLATNVTVTDALPAGLTFVSCATSQGTCGAVANVVTANLGTINPGDSATVAVIATVGAAVPNNTQIINTASVTATDVPAVVANGAITVANLCTQGLQIYTDLVSGNPIPPPGSMQTYTYRVTLRACSTVYGILLTFPANGLAACPVASGGTVRNQYGNVYWTIPSLVAGQTRTLLVTVKRNIPPGAPCGSLVQIAPPLTATYYFAAMKKTAGPTAPLNAIVTCP